MIYETIRVRRKDANITNKDNFRPGVRSTHTSCRSGTDAQLCFVVEREEFLLRFLGFLTWF